MNIENKLTVPQQNGANPSNESEEMAPIKYGFGVDIGGTTCKIGLFETNGRLLGKWEIKTDTSNGGINILRDIWQSIDREMHEWELQKSDVQGIGIGVPGAVDSRGIVNRCVNLGWGVVDAAAELSNLSGLHVRVANDANIAALGEAWMGSGKGYESIVMVTLGTGVGGGIVINGQILNGFHGAGGEIGHIVVDPAETEACTCGHYGCLEQYASATGIVRLAKRGLKSTEESSILQQIEAFTAKDVFDAAKNGDSFAKSVVQKACDLLGRTVASICNTVNPEAVLIGGGVSRAGDIIIEEMMEGFRKNIFHACRDTKILLASLGNDAGIYGGVRLVMDSTLLQE